MFVKLIIIISLLLYGLVRVLHYCERFIPYGYEDETGFHLGINTTHYNNEK